MACTMASATSVLDFDDAAFPAGHWMPDGPWSPRGALTMTAATTSTETTTETSAVEITAAPRLRSVRASGEVVDRGDAGPAMKRRKGLCDVSYMNVVLHLLSCIAVDGVGIAGDGALHEVGEESVQWGTGVAGPRQAAAAEDPGRLAEVT